MKDCSLWLGDWRVSPWRNCAGSSGFRAKPATKSSIATRHAGFTGSPTEAGVHCWRHIQKDEPPAVWPSLGDLSSTSHGEMEVLAAPLGITPYRDLRCFHQEETQ